MKPRFNWRHQYDAERDAKEGDAAATINLEESLTQQSFREDADLNVLARRFGLSDIPVGTYDPDAFRDTTNDPELAELLDIQRNAKNQFLALPAKLRKRFHNSPNELWAFVTDPENAEEALRLGLLHKIQEQKPSQKEDGPFEKPDAPSGAKATTTGSKPSSTTPTTTEASTNS